MITLIECFPHWYDGTVGGIFKTLKTTYEELFPWLSNNNDDTLDCEYYGNISGSKIISPLIEKFVRQNIDSEIDDPEILNATQKAMLCKILVNRFTTKWTKLYKVTSIEYNPIQNYNMEQVETPDITRKNGVSENYEVTDEKTSARNVTMTETPSEDFEITDEKKTASNFKVESENAAANEAYGFNSASPVPITDITNAGSVTTTGDADDNIETQKHKQVGGITRNETANADDNTETQTHKQTGYTEDIETGTRELTRTGNIGVTTSQQMIESEIKLWNWNFIETIYHDIDSVLTIAIYN